MDAPEDRSKALNEHMSSGFAPRADIVTACRHVRLVPARDIDDANQIDQAQKTAPLNSTTARPYVETSQSFEHNRHVGRGASAQCDERLIFRCPVPIFDRCNIGKFDDNHPIGSPIPLQYFV